MSLLPCVDVEPDSAANAAVIWMHGLGADFIDLLASKPSYIAQARCGAVFSEVATKLLSR